jgi:large subunit ribosomal protein L4
MPKKAKREALKTALLAKLQDNEVAFIKDFSLDQPKTREAAAALARLELEGKTLILLPEHNPVLFMSFRNIAQVVVLPVDEVNAYHLLRNRNVVFLGDAFDRLRDRLAHE